MTTQEEWKEFCHGYLVSNLGNIRKLKLKRKNLELNKTGFKRVPSARYLSLMIKNKWYYVHKIVAAMFVENKNPAMFTAILHLNGNMLDNRAENLAWVHPTMLTTEVKRNVRKVKEKESKDVIIKLRYEVIVGNTQVGLKNLGLFKSMEEASTAVKRWKANCGVKQLQYNEIKL